MPQTKTQKIVYALITVLITVNCFVFYNVYFIEKMSYPAYGGGLIGSFLLVEFLCAISCELLIGSPLSLKMAFRLVDPAHSSPLVIETVIICCTVAVMCPLMSFIAVFIYDGAVAYLFAPASFSWSSFGAAFFVNWMTKVFHNFPFALFSQLFFIQPLVRLIFGRLYAPAGAKAQA